MNNISFVCITQGKRPHCIRNMISNLIFQREFFEEFELIIVGKLPDDLGHEIVALAVEQKFNYKFILFTEHDDVGWITRKNNVGAEATQYDLIFFLHDDLWFYKDFFQKLNDVDIKSFDALGFSRRNYNTKNRPLDWVYRGPAGQFNMCYDRNSKHAYVNGGAILVHRKVWEKERWDEKLFFGTDPEDVEYSTRLKEKGYMVRCEGNLRIWTDWQGYFAVSETHSDGCNCFDVWE